MDPVLHNSGVVRSTPLLCAVNEADDILLLKTLLDFGAELELKNRVVAPPLLIVARSDLSHTRHYYLCMEPTSERGIMAGDTFWQHPSCTTTTMSFGSF